MFSLHNNLSSIHSKSTKLLPKGRLQILLAFIKRKVGLVLSFKLKHFGDLGVRPNIKMSSYQYKNSHAKDKTVSRPSYLKHGNPHTRERRSLYWDRVQAIFSPQFNPVNIIMDLCPILQMCSKHLYWAPLSWHKMNLMTFRFCVTAFYFGIELSSLFFLFIQNQSFVRVYLRPKIALFSTIKVGAIVQPSSCLI